MKDKKDLTQAQIEARYPMPRTGESMIEMFDRTFDNFHAQAIPKLRIRFALIFGDIVVAELRRGADALESIAKRVAAEK